MSDKYLFTNSEYPVEVTFFEENHLEDHSPETHEYENAVRLLVINNGEVDILCNDTIYHGKPGQAVFINVGVNHRIATSRREDTAFYNVFFDPSFVLDISDSTKLKSDYYDSLAQNPKVRCFVMDESDIFEDAAIDKINSIIVANTVRKKGYELMTKGYLCMLWVALLNYSSSTDDKKGENVYFSRDELRVSAARAFIEEKYSEYITLEDIAGRIHVSRNECCRCFQRVMFMSPVDYLITFRVFSAAKMLYKGMGESMSEVAYEVGFNNPSYFNRMFKRIMECTPTEFVKKIKDNPEEARVMFENIQSRIIGL